MPITISCFERGFQNDIFTVVSPPAVNGNMPLSPEDITNLNVAHLRAMNPVISYVWALNACANGRKGTITIYNGIYKSTAICVSWDSWRIRTNGIRISLIVSVGITPRVTPRVTIAGTSVDNIQSSLHSGFT